MIPIRKALYVAALAVVAGYTLHAQAPAVPVTQAPVESSYATTSDSQTAQKAAVAKGPERIANYVLGPEDQIVIRAFQAQELSDKQIPISGDGYISLPLLGRMKAAGFTVSGLEEDLTTRLQSFVKEPQVTVLVAEYRSQPVSVLGEVGVPGVVQLRGRKNLVEVIALAGGLRTDAGNTVTITRELSMGPIPIAGAINDSKGDFSIAHVNIRAVMEARSPQDNILIHANDVITIPKAPLLYVVGEVQKPGGYVLNEKDSISVLQVVALAGGLTPKASGKKAKILSQEIGHTNRTEVATNVQKIMSGQSPDVQLHADDILFVPSSAPKTAGGLALQTALNMAGVAIFRIP